MASMRESHPLNMPQDLIQLLLTRREITSDQLRVASIESQSTHQPLESTLVALGFITDSALARLHAEVLGVEYLDLDRFSLDPILLCDLIEEQIRKHQILPLSLESGVLRLGMVDTHNLQALDFVKQIYPEVQRIEPVLVTESALNALVEKHFARSPEEVGNTETSAVTLVEKLLHEAVKQNASDIHFEPEGAYTRIRYRLDGVLSEVQTIHVTNWRALCVRIKVLSGMNIAESRRPQNGRFSLKVGVRDIDIRAASHPVVQGENIVLRILDKSQSLLNLEELGYSRNVMEGIQTALSNPEGMIIITGPTGSGKTTSLYAMIQAINSMEVNIMTLEEPVEYAIPLIRQTQIQPPLSFPEGVKSILRQDPDIILIGEIRDEETAKMALRASMTGHKVFTTLHTRDALGVLHRLQDLGVGETILAVNITAIISQRLVRRLCEDCKEKVVISGDWAHRLKLPKVCRVYQPKGCEQCSNTGYRGRMAMAEVLFVTPQLRSLIETGAPEIKLLQALKEEGIKFLEDEARDYVLEGLTSLDEIECSLELRGVT